MSANYSKQIPRDNGNSPKQGYSPAIPALAVNASDNNAVSSIITFNDNATDIEVGAAGSGAVLKWIATTNTNASVISAAGTANFDHFIPANTVRKFVIPIESQGVSSVVGLNIQAGLYRRMAVKSVGASSVLTTQY